MSADLTLSRFSQDQQTIFEEVYSLRRKEGKWPKFQRVLIRLAKAGINLSKELSDLSHFLISYQRGSSDSPLELSVAGLSFCKEGSYVWDAFTRLIQLAVTRLLDRRDGTTEVTNVDLEEILKGRGQGDLQFAAEVILNERSGWSRETGSAASPPWSLTWGIDILDYQRVKTVEEYLKARWRTPHSRFNGPQQIHIEALRVICTLWGELKDWPTLAWYVFSQENKAAALTAIRQMPNGLLRGEHHDAKHQLNLTLEGVILADASPEIFDAFARALQWLRQHYIDTEGEQVVDLQVVADAIKVPLRLLSQMEGIFSSEWFIGVTLGQRKEKWVAQLSPGIMEYGDITNFSDYVKKRDAYKKAEEERRNQPFAYGGNIPSGLEEDAAGVKPASASERLMRTLGQYTLIKELGRGANGTVWLAADQVGKEQAIKILDPLEAKELERLHREFAIASHLDHPGLVKYLSSTLEADGDTQFIRMEYVPGVSLKSIVEWSGKDCVPQSVDQVVRWLRGCLPALGHLHQSGVVHRDLHAGNLMYCPDGSLKIVDYGSARTVRPSDESMTFKLPGTWSHSAAEVWDEPSKATAAADYYSMGVIAYLLLTGRVPFWESSVGKLYRAIEAGKRVPIRDLRPEVSEWLGLVIDLLLTVDPSRRLQEAGTIGKLLDLGTRDPEAAFEAVVKESVTRLDQRGQSGNPWAQWNLTYSVQGGLPIISQQDVLRFQRGFPSRYRDAEPGNPARLHLDAMYEIAGRIPDKAAWFLQPVVGTEPLSKDQVLLGLSMHYSTAKSDSKRHDYELQVTVANLSLVKAEDFLLEVEVPKTLMDKAIEQEVRARETRTHRFFQFNGSPLYPGKTATYQIPYFVDDRIYDLMRESADRIPPFRARIYASGMSPHALEHSIRLLNQF